jgi:aspartokinase/homoserine dehydrogenase 1
LASLRAASMMKVIKKLLPISRKHLDAVKELIAVSEQSSLLSHIKRIINRNLTDGCFSGRTINRSDTILSFGELLSSYIIAEALKQDFKTAVTKTAVS